MSGIKKAIAVKCLFSFIYGVLTMIFVRFPGQKKAASEYGPGASASKPAAATAKPAVKAPPSKKEEEDKLKKEDKVNVKQRRTN